METAWRKSSFSGTTGNCVEVKYAETVGVRDSKRPAAGQLAFAPDAWATFLQEPAREHRR
jgi:hypothetical protein